MSYDSLHDLRQRIEMYFDNELDDKSCQSLLAKVKTDPRCGKLFKKEKNFREYIKTNVKRSTVSADLIQNIKNSIRVV